MAQRFLCDFSFADTLAGRLTCQFVRLTKEQAKESLKNFHPANRNSCRYSRIAASDPCGQASHTFGHLLIFWRKPNRCFSIRSRDDRRQNSFANCAVFRSSLTFFTSAIRSAQRL